MDDLDHRDRLVADASAGQGVGRWDDRQTAEDHDCQLASVHDFPWVAGRDCQLAKDVAVECRAELVMTQPQGAVHLAESAVRDEPDLEQADAGWVSRPEYFVPQAAKAGREEQARPDAGLEELECAARRERPALQQQAARGLLSQELMGPERPGIPGAALLE